MTIGFPNRSRSYDADHDRIRFWGHDRTVEVTFLLDRSALQKLVPSAESSESSLLAAFDRVRDRILDAAMRAYLPRQNERFYVLSEKDF
jgi:hypothetical protein